MSLPFASPKADPLRGAISPQQLFDYPAKFSPSTRLIPKGESPLAVDFAEDGMKEKVMEKVRWGKPYDTIWLGGTFGCVEKPATPGRRCGSRYCKTCREVSGESSGWREG